MANFIRGRYLGQNSYLLGKTALIRQHPTDYNLLLVQFNDTSTGMGHGWHTFDTRDFVIESEDF